MTTRRTFLRALTTTTAGLLVAEDALALLVEPRRKLWAGHDFPLGGFMTSKGFLFDSDVGYWMPIYGNWPINVKWPK